MHSAHAQLLLRDGLVLHPIRGQQGPALELNRPGSCRRSVALFLGKYRRRHEHETVFVTEAPAGNEGPLAIRLKSERVEFTNTPAESDCQAVLALRSRLNLRLMTFDFAVDESGVSWLLDVNPQGNWLWREMQLSLRIADHIAASLLDTERHRLWYTLLPVDDM